MWRGSWVDDLSLLCSSYMILPCLHVLAKDKCKSPCLLSKYWFCRKVKLTSIYYKMILYSVRPLFYLFLAARCSDSAWLQWTQNHPAFNLFCSGFRWREKKVKVLGREKLILGFRNAKGCQMIKIMPTPRVPTRLCLYFPVHRSFGGMCTRGMIRMLRKVQHPWFQMRKKNTIKKCQRSLAWHQKWIGGQKTWYWFKFELAQYVGF